MSGFVNTRAVEKNFSCGIGQERESPLARIKCATPTNSVRMRKRLGFLAYRFFRAWAFTLL